MEMKYFKVHFTHTTFIHYVIFFKLVIGNRDGTICYTYTPVAMSMIYLFLHKSEAKPRMSAK